MFYICVSKTTVKHVMYVVNMLFLTAFNARGFHTKMIIDFNIFIFLENIFLSFMDISLLKR